MAIGLTIQFWLMGSVFVSGLGKNKNRQDGSRGGGEEGSQKKKKRKCNNSIKSMTNQQIFFIIERKHRSSHPHLRQITAQISPRLGRRGMGNHLNLEDNLSNNRIKRLRLRHHPRSVSIVSAQQHNESMRADYSQQQRKGTHI